MTTPTREPYGPPLPTADEAAAAGRMGWNLRCNSCGGYGATWIPGMRPGWGALALCHPHKAALEAMQRRHAQELSALTTIRFEQNGTQR
ncbi:hypothetical protein ACWDCO_24250 [Streptomyces albogriseolus]